MSKFEIEMELTGFRLKVRGERDDLPVITENLQQQVAGLISPAVNIAAGHLPQQKTNGSATNVIEGHSKGKRNSRPRRTAPTSGDTKTVVINWDHDPGKWGFPRQSWKSWQKITWLLHVVSQECSVNELTAGLIVETFNTHFRQAETLKQGSMTRDLGRMKQKTPALIGDHAGKSPITWFLTDAGIQEALKLVVEAKGSAASTPASD